MTPNITDYDGIGNEENFGSPRILIKQSQPLLSKNSFISYLNETTQETPLSPSHNRKYLQKNTTASYNSTSPMMMSRPGGGSYMPPTDQHKSYMEKFHAMQQALATAGHPQ